MFSILLFRDFMNPHKISTNSDNFYCLEPMFWDQIQLVTWGVTNQDVLLLYTVYINSVSPIGSKISFSFFGQFCLVFSQIIGGCVKPFFHFRLTQKLLRNVSNLMCNMWQQIYTRIYKHSLWNTKGSSSQDTDLKNAASKTKTK